ncbi:serine protease [Flavobacteriaceae bacterium SZ-1-7]|uniref:S1 family peptidase n=1 Tax=Tamlana sedimenti TaxID=3134126 RepID=UPI003125EDB3
MKYIMFSILIGCFSWNISNSQNKNTASNLDDRVHGLTTLITTQGNGENRIGTGFFFQELSPKDTLKNGQWRTIENMWLVTNRHVSLLRDKKGNETLPDSFTFHLRRINGLNIVWEPITIKKDELKTRLKLHSDKNIDIALVKVFDLVMDKIKSGQTYMQFYAVSEDDLPGKNKINVEVTDDVVTIGYPKNFYDQKNVFPIVKQGIISSRWGSFFNGSPYFLIDSKLFPGSSGSIVISKPQNIVLDKGQIFHNENKQFAFLGVYSGEPFKIQPNSVEFDDMVIFRRDKFDVGIVWYSNLVVDIINNGVQIK